MKSIIHTKLLLLLFLIIPCLSACNDDDEVSMSGTLRVEVYGISEVSFNVYPFEKNGFAIREEYKKEAAFFDNYDYEVELNIGNYEVRVYADHSLWEKYYLQILPNKTTTIKCYKDREKGGVRYP